MADATVSDFDFDIIRSRFTPCDIHRFKWLFSGICTNSFDLHCDVMVYTSGKKMPMVVEGSGEYSWLLTTEEGTQYKGHVTGGKAFNLPTKLPEGYHTLTLTQDDQRAHCRVIVAPKRCYEPQALLNKQKLCCRLKIVSDSVLPLQVWGHRAYPGLPAGYRF